jgi:hypothetical protein
MPNRNKPQLQQADENLARSQELAERQRRELEQSREIERAQDEGAPDQQAASILLEPPSPPAAALGGWFLDNVENPRGVPSSLTDGTPNAQATDAQKIQDPVPSRPPLAATATTSVLERVSAGQNRKAPQERVPVLFWLCLVPTLVQSLF